MLSGPEDGAHGVGAPGVGFDDLAVPQRAVAGVRRRLCGIARLQAVAQKERVDVGDDGVVLIGHRSEGSR